jgi:hypothetical protein
MVRRPEQKRKTQQLAYQLLELGTERDRLIATVNDSAGILFPEIALEGPVVGKTDQRAGCFDRNQRDEISPSFGPPRRVNDSHDATPIVEPGAPSRI